MLSQHRESPGHIAAAILRKEDAMKTGWINFRIEGSIATYVKIAGLYGNIDPEKNKKLENFQGIAAVSLDEYRCETCARVKEQLRVEGLIPGPFDPNIGEIFELHAYARSSMKRKDEEDAFGITTSWSGQLTAVVSGESVVTRGTPAPPGYPNKIRNGQTLQTWAKDGPEFFCNVVKIEKCPICLAKDRADEEWERQEEERERERERMKNPPPEPPSEEPEFPEFSENDGCFEEE